MKRYRLKPRFYIITCLAVAVTMGACIYTIDTRCRPIAVNAAEPQIIEEVEHEEIEEPEYLGEYKITHYCACEKCCGEWALNRPLDENGEPIVITASGAVAEAGKTIAVDPDVIPLGSTVIIDGEEYIAQDVGGAIKGNRIDIYCSTHEEALQKGVGHYNVYLEV